MKKIVLSILAILILHVTNLQSKIWVIGDSTVSPYSDSYYPRQGWGELLQQYLASNNVTIAVDNQAVSGRSSKSFYDEGRWQTIYDNLSAGDYVFIQFGHNDEKTDDAARGTDPFTTYQQYLSKYIDQAENKGAYPVLITPMHRNYWSNGEIVDSHGDYPVAMRQLATQKSIPLIDLHQLSKSYFEGKGETFTTTSIFMNLSAGQYPNYPDGSADNTHFQVTGAKGIANLVVKGIIANSYSEMKALMGNTCTATSITPYLQVNGGTWQNTSSVTVNAEDAVKFGPQPTSGGSWSWSGLASGTSREVTIYPTASGTATATYTNSCGTQSTQDFDITVSSSSNPATLTKHGAGSRYQTVDVNTAITSFYYTWANATSVNVSGLPSGVDAAINNSANSVTFSGTPTVAGTYDYTITTTGGSPNASVTGTFTVNSGGTSPVTLTIQENTTGFCSVDGTVDNNNSGFTGSGFANTANASGNGITWSVNVPSSGSYSLVWQFANGGSTDRTAQLMVDGSVVNSSVSMPSTGSWTTWTASSSISANLSAGNRLIRLQATNSSGLSNIDYINITGNNPTGVSCTDLRNISTNTATQFQNNKLNIYPNPVIGDVLNITLNDIEGNSLLRILDYSGKTIIQKEFCDESKVQLNVDGLFGMYIIQLINNNQTIVRKVSIK